MKDDHSEEHTFSRPGHSPEARLGSEICQKAPGGGALALGVGQVTGNQTHNPTLSGTLILTTFARKHHISSQGNFRFWLETARGKVPEGEEKTKIYA